MAQLLAEGRRVDRGFERLYRRHVADVYHYALAVLRNPADAEDVTQTTFLNALRAYERGERPKAEQNWLIAIAHNVCRQRFRQSQRRPREVSLDEDVADRMVDEDAPSADDIRRALPQPTSLASLFGGGGGAAVGTGVAAKAAAVVATGALLGGAGYEGATHTGLVHRMPLPRRHAPAEVARAPAPTPVVHAVFTTPSGHRHVARRPKHTAPRPARRHPPTHPAHPAHPVHPAHPAGAAHPVHPLHPSHPPHPPG